ncbi:hypothetical protein PMAYCL1PPCAC_21174, partial [Pristionchus mayeri]
IALVIMLRAILCVLFVFGVSEARVDFEFSKIFDEYDFWGRSSISVDALCKDSCHIYASITEESRKQTSNILIQTGKGFTSLADLADRRNSTNGQKLSLEISNTATLTIVNGNANLAAGPLVLYIVNKQAPNFAGAEVYEAEGLRRPSSTAHAITVMSARPFTLTQAKLTGMAAQQEVLARVTGFDVLNAGSDTCLNAFYLNYEPFPGFTLSVNAPIVSLLYTSSQFMGPAGELTATIGISNFLQMQRSGFFNSPGYHGCAGKSVYRSSLYNYNAPSRVDVANATPQNIVVDVYTNSDEKHAVKVADVTSGKTSNVYSVNGPSSSVSATLKYFTQDVIVNWEQDGIVDYHYMVRYNSTIPQ